MEKIAVYTGIFGGYDPYVEPDFGDGVDLFLLTDVVPKITPNRAKVFVVQDALAGTRTARLHKARAAPRHAQEAHAQGASGGCRAASARAVQRRARARAA